MPPRWSLNLIFNAGIFRALSLSRLVLALASRCFMTGILRLLAAW